jgi:hypothetical protein
MTKTKRRSSQTKLKPVNSLITELVKVLQCQVTHHLLQKHVEKRRTFRQGIAELHSFVYSLHNDTFSSSDYIGLASNERMIR